MKPAVEGCAICGSTWGNVSAIVDGKRRRFCCDVCERQFRGLLAKVKEATAWPEIDRLEISGDPEGRVCRAERGTETRAFFIAFNPLGAVRVFRAYSSLPE